MSESRELTSNRKDNIKQLVKAKVPKLNELTAQFMEELSRPDYLNVETDTTSILE
jgi:hypothetical protein